MKIEAAIARGVDRDFVIEPVDLEEPRVDEVLVKLVATGICHTDIFMRDHKIYPIPHPVVLGHEGAGIVVRTGAGVSKVKTGDHVIMTAGACGHCISCAAGKPSYCDEFNEHNFYGSRPDGSSPLSQHGKMIHYFQSQSSFADHAIATERNVVKVPRDAPLEMLGPIGCGIITGAGAIMNSMQVTAGASVAVFGTGAVGLAAVMAARLVGAATIVAVDLVDSRLELARELGATHTINTQTQSASEAIMAITGGRGVNFTLDTTANMKVLRQAMDVLAMRGTCGFVGGAPKGMEVSIDVEHIMTGGRSIRGIILGDSTPDVFLTKLVDLYTKGRFPIDRLISFYDFADINKAVADALSGRVVKPVLRF
jgi:aryl-alcohol dehydrogenase